MRPRDVLGTTNVHLDFHTPADAPDVGADFDPDRFGDRLVAAGVDSIALFAKCHHGNSYYDTEAGVRHPELDFDLLAAQVEACRERDIGVLAYYSLVWDDRAGEQADWLQHAAGDDPEAPEPLAATDREDRWDWLCLNSPYYEEVVLPQVRELCEYDLDGFFFDILMYHGDACACRYCRAAMADAGRDPASPEDRRAHRRELCERVAARTTREIRDRGDFLVTYNHPLELGLTSSLSGAMDFALIESLPAGWGYLHTPLYARYARNLPIPAYGMTGVFHKAWGDFGTVKAQPQLRHELSLSLSHHLPVSVGDQLRPRGELDPAKYDTMGEAFAFAHDRGLPPADPVRDVALLAPGSPDPVPDADVEAADAPVGAAKLLLDAGWQFDAFDPATLDLADCGAVVLPAAGELPSPAVERVREFVAGGGGLLAAGNAAPGGAFALGDVLGVERAGRLPYSTAYLDLDRFEGGVPDTELVSYGPLQRVVPDGASVAARAVGPTTERSASRGFSHQQAPPERPLDAPAVTVNEYGDGRAAYVAADLFGQYYREDYHGHRALLDNLLAHVDPAPVLDLDAPTSVEANLMRADGATYLHLLNFHANRGGESIPRIDDVRPVRDVTATVDVGAGDADPVTDTRVSTTETADGRLRVTVAEVGLHEVVRLS